MIIEYGERKIENLSLKTAIALSKALGVGIEELDWIIYNFEYILVLTDKWPRESIVSGISLVIVVLKQQPFNVMVMLRWLLAKKYKKDWKRKPCIDRICLYMLLLLDNMHLPEVRMVWQQKDRYEDWAWIFLKPVLL